MMPGVPPMGGFQHAGTGKNKKVIENSLC